MRRRSFLKAGAVGGAGVVLGAGYGAAAAGAPVYRVRDDAVFTEAGTLDQPRVRVMLNTLITSLAGMQSVPAAWRTFFDPDDVVGIKVNAINGPLTAYNRQVVMGVVEELLGIGIPADRIIIFDRSDTDLKRGGFRIVTGGADVRCYGAAEAGYEVLPVTLDGVDARLTRIVTRTCTALVNMPILRAHELAGMSFAVKNMMGAAEKPSALHPGGVYRAADLYAVPHIADKVRLVIGDCLRPVYEDAAEPASRRSGEYTLMVGLDPVALDAAGAALLARIRKNVKKRKWPLAPAVATIARAEALGLGTASYRLTERSGRAG